MTNSLVTPTRTMLRHAAVLAGFLRGGGRLAPEVRQLQQVRYLNVHEYQVRLASPKTSFSQIAAVVTLLTMRPTFFIVLNRAPS